ncbi:MAG: hypothetical protein AAGI07_12535 [Bacteroidota bacterium]
MDFKEIAGNLYITDPDHIDIVNFEEINFDNMNCIRIFETKDPEKFNFQLRAKQSLKGKQKARNVVATVEFSVEDMERIIKFMKKDAEVNI